MGSLLPQVVAKGVFMLRATQNNLMIQPVPADEFSPEVDALLVDRQARGLSPDTVLFCPIQLPYHAGFLSQADVVAVLAVTPHHLRRNILA
jgi:hypothetical protein